MLSLVRIKIKVYDLHGCVRTYNDAVKVFNNGLRALCAELRSELKDATIVYVDIFNIKYDLIANSTKYGFDKPLMSCCGHGGAPYNYNTSYICGHHRCGVCNASKILSIVYSTPQLKFDYFCRA